MANQRPIGCPFCGMEGEVDSIDCKECKRPSEYFVECPNNDCKVGPSTDFFPTADEAIIAWNTRTPLAPEGAGQVSGEVEAAGG